MKKKLALEIFLSGVVVFDMMGYYANNLPIWPFIPMWAWAMVEVEAGARVLGWLSKRARLSRLWRSSKSQLPMQ